jgi:H+/Cl- antiporter ClcA
MEGLGFAKSKEYWVRFGWGILMGFLSALGAYIFVALMDFGLNLLWTEQPGAAFLSGNWQIVVILTAAGLLVGLLYHFTNAREVNGIMAMVKGDVDTKPIPAGLLVSLISLVGGFSLGPEVPAGMIAAGLSTWVSKWRNLSAEIRKSNIISTFGYPPHPDRITPYAVFGLLRILDHRCRGSSNWICSVLRWGRVRILRDAYVVGITSV